MAILANTAYTLADWQAQTDDQGNIAPLINMLSQYNPMLADIPWLECNEVMSHRANMITGLPGAYWRQYNAGVPRGKHTTAVSRFTCAMLETYSEVDVDLLRLNGNDAAWRYGQDMAFADGINQQMATAMFYGNQELVPGSFTGLSPFYNSLQTSVPASAKNVISAGGTGATNTSIWAVVWGQNTVHGIYPKGSRAGLAMQDVSTDAPVQDGSGNLYQVKRTKFKWDCGLAVPDWRYAVRIANIDVSSLATANAPNILALLTLAINKFPALPARNAVVQAATEAAGLPLPVATPAIYVNRTIQNILELQAQNKSNVHLMQKEFDGMPVLSYRGVPIRVSDALLNTEAPLV